MRASLLTVSRVYDPPRARDGLRVLVDRLWPRGLSKRAAALHAWYRDAAPSPRLRQWFGHDPARYQEFRTRYFAELDARPEAVEGLRELVGRRRAVLLFAAADPVHNNAVALRDYLLGRR